MDFALGGAQRLQLMIQLEERVRQLRVPLDPGPHECHQLRLQLMNQLEERARQLRVPLAPGPRECRYYRLLEGDPLPRTSTSSPNLQPIRFALGRPCGNSRKLLTTRDILLPAERPETPFSLSSTQLAKPCSPSEWN